MHPNRRWRASQSRAARPRCITPHIRFFPSRGIEMFIAPQLRIGLPSDPASRRRPCPSPCLRLCENLAIGLSFTYEVTCHARHTRRRSTARGFWRVRCDGLLGHIRRPRSDFYQFRTDCALSDFSVISGLSAEPIAVGQTEKSAEPQISISGYAAFSRDNIANTLGRNTDFLREAILANAHGL